MWKNKGWLRDISSQIIGGVVATVLIALGLAFWAWLKALDPIFIVLIFLAVVAVVFVIINQADSFSKRRKRGVSKYNDKEIEDAVREWVDIPGFTFKRNMKEWANVNRPWEKSPMTPPSTLFAQAGGDVSSRFLAR
jgi:hypothetical protein